MKIHYQRLKLKLLTISENRCQDEICKKMLIGGQVYKAKPPHHCHEGLVKSMAG